MAVDVRPGYGSPDDDDAAIAGHVVDFDDFAGVNESVFVSDESRITSLLAGGRFRPCAGSMPFWIKPTGIPLPLIAPGLTEPMSRVICLWAGGARRSLKPSNLG